VVLIGPDDRAQGQFGLKEMAGGTQRAIGRAELGSALEALGCRRVRSAN
jgi:hypothetical protein